MQAQQLPGPHVSSGTGAAGATAAYAASPTAGRTRQPPAAPHRSVTPLGGLGTGERGVQEWHSCGCHHPWVRSFSSRGD